MESANRALLLSREERAKMFTFAYDQVTLEVEPGALLSVAIQDDSVNTKIKKRKRSSEDGANDAKSPPAKRRRKQLHPGRLTSDTKAVVQEQPSKVLPPTSDGDFTELKDATKTMITDLDLTRTTGECRTHTPAQLTNANLKPADDTVAADSPSKSSSKAARNQSAAARCTAKELLGDMIKKQQSRGLSSTSVKRKSTGTNLKDAKQNSDKTPPIVKGITKILF